MIENAKTLKDLRAIDEHVSTLESRLQEAERRANEAGARVKELEAESRRQSQVFHDNQWRQLGEMTKERDQALAEMSNLRAENAELREALEIAEAAMSIVEPRSDKAKYMDALRDVRRTLSAVGHSPVSALIEAGRLALVETKAEAEHQRLEDAEASILARNAAHLRRQEATQARRKACAAIEKEPVSNG